jgi:hypothetical protein
MVVELDSDFKLYDVDHAETVLAEAAFFPGSIFLITGTLGFCYAEEDLNSNRGASDKKLCSLLCQFFNLLKSKLHMVHFG